MSKSCPISKKKRKKLLENYKETGKKKFLVPWLLSLRKTAGNIWSRIIAQHTAEGIEHQIVDVKDPVRGGVNAVQGGKLCQFKEQREGKRQSHRLFQAAVEVISQIDTERKEQTDVAADLKPCGVRDVYGADPGQDPICLFFKVMEKGQRMKLHPYGKRVFQYIFKGRQRRDDIKVHTDEIKNEQIHSDHPKEDNSAVFPVLIDHAGNEKDNGDKRKKGIHHAKGDQVFMHKIKTP